VEGFEDRFTSVERRLDGLDAKVDRFREELGGRIEALDRKVDRIREELGGRMSRYFVWSVGIQVAVLLAVVSALAGR
jgi:hypothetical protein